MGCHVMEADGELVARVTEMAGIEVERIVEAVSVGPGRIDDEGSQVSPRRFLDRADQQEDAVTPRTGRSNTSLVLALLALLSFAACGGGTGGSGTDGGGDGTNSGETAAGETPTQPPAAGGGGDLPDIADGLYAAGTVHLEVSGDKSLNVDLALIPGASSTTNGATLLFYGSGEGQDATALTIVLEAEAGPGFNLTSPVVLSAGGRASGCRFEVTTNDGSGLEGTFSCSGIDGMVAGGLENPQIDVRATFSADR